MQMVKMLLPMMLPTRSSLSWRLAAVMVVTSSGSEVPNATTVSAMMRSEIPMEAASHDAELTTNWLPATTPTSPSATNRNDRGNFHFGFSTTCFSLRPRRIIAMM